MKKFSEFGIKPDISYFDGDKIKIEKILNIPIIVLNYKISDSSKKPGTKLLTLHIRRNGANNVIFCGATILMGMLDKIPKDGFPFETTIIKNGEHYEFT